MKGLIPATTLALIGGCGLQPAFVPYANEARGNINSRGTPDRRGLYLSTIGGALSLKIATYFNSVALCESSGTPPKRTIRTAATALVDLKNPASFRMLAALPLETGLADFFATVQA